MLYVVGTNKGFWRLIFSEFNNEDVCKFNNEDAESCDLDQGKINAVRLHKTC